MQNPPELFIVVIIDIRNNRRVIKRSKNETRARDESAGQRREFEESRRDRSGSFFALRTCALDGENSKNRASRIAGSSHLRKNEASLTGGNSYAKNRPREIPGRCSNVFL